MPGIFGLARNDSGSFLPAKVSRRMQDLLRYHPNFRFDPLYNDQFVSAGFYRTDIINGEPRPFTKDDVSIWLDGEFYNQPEIQKQFNVAAADDSTLLYQLYKDHDCKSFLQAIDGVFSAVIYDRHGKCLLLLCDRYGMKHLYISHNSNFIGWSSEIKALTALPWFSNEIDKDAVKKFMRYGYFIEDNTWFDSAKLIPPASLIRFSLVDGSIERETYWSWNRIKPISGPVNIREAGNEWGRLFTDAVRKRVHPGEHVGITLSGGLDSRVILAAFPDNLEQVQTATFGKKKCMDVDIAARVSAVKKARHHIFEINEFNWLPNRLAGVWATEGQLSIIDMHGIECLQSIAKIFNINLNGMGGDGIHGGSFLSSVKQHMSTTDDPYGYRGRRFIRIGTMLDEPWIHNRLPFYDNKLIEFTLSLPVSMRKNSHFYRIALLQTFPDYFEKIPWQKTGLPLSAPEPIILLYMFVSRFRNRLGQKLGRLSFMMKNNHDFVDYASWIRKDPGKSFFKKLLISSDTIYSDYFERKTVEKLLNEHNAGIDNSSIICRCATIELWLRQILRKTMLPDPATGQVIAY